MVIQVLRTVAKALGQAAQLLRHVSPRVGGLAPGAQPIGGLVQAARLLLGGVPLVLARG